MDLSRIKRTLAQLKYLKKTLHRHADRLLPGNYYLFFSMRAMVAADSCQKNRAREYFEKHPPMGKMARLLSCVNRFGYLHNKSKTSSCEYEAVYLANNFDADREIKLFSFEKKKIMTVCVDKATCEKQIRQYRDLSGAYPMPKTTLVEQVANAFEISMIEFAARPAEKYALEHIAASTGAYNQPNMKDLERVAVSDLISFNYDLETNRLLSGIVSRIDKSLLECSLPLCVQHGDLSIDNLLYGEAEGRTGFWWIDWEHIGQRVFFYDYLFYILNSAFCEKNDAALKFYFSEAQTPMLKAFFERFGVAYEAKNAMDFFLIFAVLFLKERVCDKGNFTALKSYCEFIDLLLKGK